MQEISYYNRLIHMLEQIGPSESEVNFKCFFGAVTGLFIGLTLSFIPGSVIAVGLLAGLTLGWRWAGEHNRLLAALNRLPEGEKDRVIGLVQGVVGGSKDIQDLEYLVNSWRRNRLLSALKQNLNIKTI